MSHNQRIDLIQNGNNAVEELQKWNDFGVDGGQGTQALLTNR